ncbi:MAG: potassium transporter TrkG [Pseudomonadota bacterium]
MNVSASVIYVYGWLFAFMALAMLVPIGFAFAYNEPKVVQAFIVTALATGFLGVAIVFALKGQNTKHTRRQSLFLLGTVWFILPCVAALPFYLAQTPNTLLQAYFEAVSGLTTTGATIFVDLSEIPKSIIVWRALIQWIGGFITLLSLVAILAPVIMADAFDNKFRQVRQTLPAAHRQLFETLPKIFPIYALLTLTCFLFLLIAKIPAFDAFCLSLSTVSTGGFMPRPGSISLYGSPFAEFVLTVFMFLGAVSILWVKQMVEFKWRNLLKVREPMWIAGIIFGLGSMLAIRLLLDAPSAELSAISHTFTLGLATAASFVSTTGFVVSDRTQDILPFTVVIMICILGGGRMSTAGGLKFFRFSAMLGQSGRELVQLIFPHGVQQARYSTQNHNSLVMRSVWANFAVMMITMWLLAALIAVTGLPLSASLLAALSSISNIGPAYSLTALPDLTIAQSYAAMHPGAHAALCLGMILGRVEILALLSLLNIAYWRS